MSLSPYTTTLASGAAGDQAATETYDIATRGRKGLVLVTDVTAIGNGHSYVTSADITLPVVIDSTHNQFGYGGATTHDFILPSGTYTTIAQLVAAFATIANDEDNVGGAWATLVTVSADPNGTGLRFTSVPSGVNTTAFSTGVENDCLGLLGLTNAWTIAHTQPAGADGAFSETITIQGKDEASGKFYTILTAAAVSTVSTQVLQVHPQMTAVNNLVANALLPANIRVSIAHTTSNSITRTRGLQLVS